MRGERHVCIGVFLFVALFAIHSGAQVKKPVTPFDSYRQNTANELSVREVKFDIAAIHAFIAQRQLLQNGFCPPQIEGLATDGKLQIEVMVYSSELPKTVDARRDAMLVAVNLAKAAYSAGFGTKEMPEDFDKWTRVNFFDVDALTKSTGKKPADPVIGAYENGELVLR
jgi:hypothetical protein